MFTLESSLLPWQVWVSLAAVGLWFVWDMGQVIGEAIAERIGL